MIDAQELLFVVDESNQPLSPLPRKLVHMRGLWHRTSGIWVVNSRHQLLCQKRSLKKDIKPGMWEAFLGGHVAPGDNYLKTAVAELGEELGIIVDAGGLIPYEVLKSDKPTHREFQHIFAYRLDTTTVNEFAFEKDEIDELRWYDLTEVEKILLRDNRQDWVHKPWDREVLEWLEGLG